MSKPVVDTFDIASLEAFIAELVAAGFEPVPQTERRRWRGKIHPAFAPLTEATLMELVLVDGWPYQPPAVFVQGLDTNHSMLSGLVCLWREGDVSQQWITVEGLFDRIEAWCADAQQGWNRDDLGRDAYLNFSPKGMELATFDLQSLGTSAGGWGEFHGITHRPLPRVDLLAGRGTSSDHLRGLWFRVGALAVPPRQLSELRRCLSRTQWKGLERALAERRTADPMSRSGGVDLILLCWDRGTQLDVLVIACRGVGNEAEGIALQAGPNDHENLILRAGPDAAALRDRKVVIFGAGALGSHASLLLGESGLGTLRVVDRETLTPGNVVRHVAGHNLVGAPKVFAVQMVVRGHAPWISVEPVVESPIEPSRIDVLIADVDLVMDATGNAAATLAISARAKAASKPIISGALYRGGAVARVRRQAVASDTPLDRRTDEERYPIIPADQDEDFARAAVSCSAPVNNAPPTSVVGCAALLAEAAIDVLTGRFRLDDEVLDVYHPLPDTPRFDRRGRVQSVA